MFLLESEGFSAMKSFASRRRYDVMERFENAADSITRVRGQAPYLEGDIFHAAPNVAACFAPTRNNEWTST